MNKKVLSVAFLLFTLCFSLFLLGCKHEQIKFYRESAASNLMNKFNPEKEKANTPSGMIILKDEKNSSGQNINFGPRDINFDLPIKIK